MKKILTILFLTFSLGIFSQILEPVKWETFVEKISETEYTLIAKATLEDKWHIYSQNVPEDGPIATEFTFNTESENFKLIGETVEENGETIYDPVFMMKVKFFEHATIFKQKIQLLKKQSQVKGTVYFGVCDDTQCLAPEEIELIFNLDTTKTSSIESKKKIVVDNKNTNNLLYGMNTKEVSNSVIKCEKPEQESRGCRRSPRN